MQERQTIVGTRRPSPPADSWIDRHPVVALVGTVELTLGVCITGFFIVCVMIMVGGSILLNAWTEYPTIFRPAVRMGLTIGWLIIVPLGGVSLHHLMRAVQRAKSPKQLSVATEWLHIPLLLRPAIAIWWAALALLSPLTAHYVMAQISFLTPTPGERLLQSAAPWIILFEASIATNTNFLIAVAAFTGSASFLKFASRIRLLIDAAVCTAIYFAHLPVITFSSWGGGI